MHNLILSPIALETLVEAIAVRTVDILNRSEKKPENRRFSVKETAKRNSVSELSIRNYIKEGKIEATRIGRRILIDESQFEKGLSEVKSLKYKR